MSWDLVTGKDFTGFTIGSVTKDPLQFSKWILQSFAPFAVEEIPSALQQISQGTREGEREDILAGSATIVGEVFGAKSYPLSFGDLKAIVSAEMFNGRRFEDLNTDERRAVLNDERVTDRAGEFAEDRGTPKERANTSFDTRSRANKNFESALRDRYDMGLRGSGLRSAIQGFKRDRFAAAQAIFSDPEVQEYIKREKVHIDDVYAELYWSVPLEIIHGTGELDWRGQEIKRDSVLADAKANGVSENYITGTGEGTFRGTRFEDPLIRMVIEKYEADMDVIGSRYYELAESDHVVGSLTRDQKELWIRWLDGSKRFKKSMEDANPWIKIVSKWNREERKMVRQSDKETNDILVEWHEYDDIYNGSNIAMLRLLNSKDRRIERGRVRFSSANLMDDAEEDIRGVKGHDLMSVMRELEQERQAMGGIGARSE
jgi:hypothetical protein